MTAVTATKWNCDVSDSSASSRKRLFNLLDEQAKERVVRALTAFRTLTLLEQEAFAEELGVCLPSAVEQHFVAGTRPLSGPALQVRSRDPCYVALAAPVIARSMGNASAELTEMIMPFLTEKTVFDSPVKEKEKEKEKEDTEEKAEEHGDASYTENENLAFRTLPTSEGFDEGVKVIRQLERKTHGVEGELVSSDFQPLLYRSRAYQALRLSRDEQRDPGTDPLTRPSVMNLTGMPIDDADLLEWFELLDVTRTGKIGVVPFLAAIKELERDFGVGEKAEAKFAEEVEALATNGLLTYEKFAFLVSRFVRQ